MQKRRYYSALIMDLDLRLSVRTVSLGCVSYFCYIDA